jgi:transposase InsO family protein
MPTLKRYFYDIHEQLKANLTDFLRAYNFARRLKTLKGLTPMKPSANHGLKPQISIKCRD